MIILLDRIFEFSLLGKVCRYGVCGEGSEPNVYDYTGRMLGSQGIQKSLFCFIKKNSIEVLYPIECSQGREICMSQGNVCISDGVTQRQNLEEPMHGLLCLCLYTLVMEASPLVWVSA